MTDDVGRVLPQGTGPPVTIPGPIFAAAVDTFMAGQRLDMRSLARRVGVARATLYRRAGNREQLLDQVLWWRARRLLADPVRASAHLTGTDRLTSVTRAVPRALRTDRPGPRHRPRGHRHRGPAPRARSGAPPPCDRRAAGALMAIDLDGAVALVTGGANGIGAAGGPAAGHPRRPGRGGRRRRAGRGRC